MQENIEQPIPPLPPPSPQVILTDSAAHKLRALFLKEENLETKLRIFIEGGGCSGFKYEFAFETEVEIDDHVFTKHMPDYTVDVVVDSMSLLYLLNAEVDYEENFQDSRFIVRNPNAQTTCGCGSSFSVSDTNLVSDTNSVSDTNPDENDT